MLIFLKLKRRTMPLLIASPSSSCWTPIEYHTLHSWESPYYRRRRRRHRSRRSPVGACTSCGASSLRSAARAPPPPPPLHIGVAVVVVVAVGVNLVWCEPRDANSIHKLHTRATFTRPTNDIFRYVCDDDMMMMWWWWPRLLYCSAVELKVAGELSVCFQNRKMG